MLLEVAEDRPRNLCEFIMYGLPFATSTFLQTSIAIPNLQTYHLFYNRDFLFVKTTVLTNVLSRHNPIRRQATMQPTI